MRIDALYEEAVKALTGRGFPAGEVTAALSAARSEGVSQPLRAEGLEVTVTYAMYGQYYLYVNSDEEAAP